MFDTITVILLLCLFLGIGGFCFILVLAFGERDNILRKWQEDLHKHKRKENNDRKIH